MVQLADLKGAVMIIALIALVAGATAIALTELQDDSTIQGADCVDGDNCSHAYNNTQNGLVGIDNSTSFLGVIGTILGVMVLVGIVVTAFAFGKR